MSYINLTFYLILYFVIIKTLTEGCIIKLCSNNKPCEDLTGEMNSSGEELLQGFFLIFGSPNLVGEENFQGICLLETLDG